MPVSDPNRWLKPGLDLAILLDPADLDFMVFLRDVEEASSPADAVLCIG